MASHRARTWASKCGTPVVRFGCASRGRITMAALTCSKAGERSRLIYRPRIRGDHRGFAWQDYRDLLVRAHLRLGGPVVVVWDNPNVHRCSRLRQYVAEHNWLAIVQLPTFAPDLNPVAGIWSLLRCTTTPTSSSPTASTLSKPSAAACAASDDAVISLTDTSPKPDSR